MSIESIARRIQDIQAWSRNMFGSAAPEAVFSQMLEEAISTGTQTAGRRVQVTAAHSDTADAGGSLPAGAARTQEPSGKIVTDPHANAGRTTYTGQVNSEIASQAQPYMDYIEEASSVYGVPANIIMAVIKRESDYSVTETSHSGAMGLMQNMPFNCDDYGVTEPYDPYQNIMCGTWQLGTLLDMYDGDLRLAIAGYAIGCGTLRRAGVDSSDSPAFQTQVPEHTRSYIEDILRYAGMEA